MIDFENDSDKRKHVSSQVRNSKLNLIISLLIAILILLIWLVLRELGFF